MTTVPLCGGLCPLRLTHLEQHSKQTQEVDLLHVTDGDRSNVEAYLDSIDRLLEEQDQELERCVSRVVWCGVVWVWGTRGGGARVCLEV